MEGTRGRGRSRKTWEQCVRDDMKLLGLHPECVMLLILNIIEQVAYNYITTIL